MGQEALTVRSASSSHCRILIHPLPHCPVASFSLPHCHIAPLPHCVNAEAAPSMPPVVVERLRSGCSRLNAKYRRAAGRRGRSDDRIGRCGISSRSRSTFQTLPVRQPPVVAAEHAQVDHAYALHAAGRVDVRIEVAQREVPQAIGRPACRPCRPGSRDRATEPQRPRALVDEDHVIEFVDRLQAHDERRIAVLLENDGAVSAASRQCAVRCGRRRETTAASPGPAAARCCTGSAFRKRCTAVGRAQRAGSGGVSAA